MNPTHPGIQNVHYGRLLAFTLRSKKNISFIRSESPELYWFVEPSVAEPVWDISVCSFYNMSGDWGTLSVYQSRGWTAL